MNKSKLAYLTSTQRTLKLIRSNSLDKLANSRLVYSISIYLRHLFGFIAIIGVMICSSTAVASVNLIDGDDTNQVLVGTNQRDTVYGGFMGNDLIIGRHGDDVLVGDTRKCNILGARLAQAEYGNNIIFGGFGDDFLIGTSGGYFNFLDYNPLAVENDELFDEDLRLELKDDDGFNMLFGGFGNDIIVGNGAFKTQTEDNLDFEIIIGGAYIRGGPGNDIASGRNGYQENSFLGYYRVCNRQPGVPGSVFGDSFCSVNPKDDENPQQGATVYGGRGDDIVVATDYEIINHDGATLPDENGDIEVMPAGLLLHLDIWQGTSHLFGERGNDFIAKEANIVTNYHITTLTSLCEDDTLGCGSTAGNMVAKGGPGHDTIVGDSVGQRNYLVGPVDFTKLVSMLGDDKLHGNRGNDILVGDDSDINTHYENISDIDNLQVNTSFPCVADQNSVCFGLLATGFGAFNGSDELQGGRGDDLLWGDDLQFEDATAPTDWRVRTKFDGKLLARYVPLTDPSTLYTTNPGDTFIFDMKKGWDRDVLMDFNGVEPIRKPGLVVDIPELPPQVDALVGLVGDPRVSRDPNAPLNPGAGPFIEIVRKDKLKFINLGDKNKDGKCDYKDVDRMIRSIEPTTNHEPAVVAGTFFERDTRVYENPETDNGLLMAEVNITGQSHRAVYQIPEGRTKIKMRNGDQIILANVEYADLYNDKDSIKDIFNTENQSDVLKNHVIVEGKRCN